MSSDELHASAKPRWTARLGEFLTYDYACRLDPYIKWVRNPLAVLVLATVGSGLCGMCVHPQGFVLAAGLAVVLVIGVIWPWIVMWGVSGSISYEKARAREGDEVGARLLIRNRSPLGVWGLSLHGSHQEPLLVGDGSPDMSLSCVGGWRSIEKTRDFVPLRRGVYPLCAPRVATGFPFGLRSVSPPLAVLAPLVVWPRTFPVGPIPEIACGRCSEGTSLRDRAGHSGDMLGVRPYRRGDSLRRIHWPQTARSGDLMICELQERALPSVQIVLDLNDDVHVGQGRDGSREWAIRVAASFLDDWISQGADAEAIFATQVISLREGSVSSRRNRVLDSLACVGESDRHSLQSILDSSACKSFDRGLRIVVTTDVGLRCLEGRLSRQRERFVVLASLAFGGRRDATVASPFPLQPWVMLDEPNQIPQQIRHVWKEFSHGH